ncbi:hypothetical protein [Agrobacterium sp. NPDC090283]|uniref:hypothetical protein n=1 Tax=Agrobacterium sp. NPDC090283 TaxID=3363920 RepID=UPI00383B328E
MPILFRRPAVAAAAMAIVSLTSATAAELPEGFDAFMDDLDFAAANCTLRTTPGMYRFQFNEEALWNVTRRLHQLRTQANGGFPPLIRIPNPVEKGSISERCNSVRDTLGRYAENVLGVPGLIR